MCVCAHMSICVRAHVNVSMIKKEFQRSIGQHCQVPNTNWKTFPEHLADCR